MKRTTYCVCGGGSMAHALAAVLGAKSGTGVRVLTRRPEDWSSSIKLVYRDELELIGHLSRVSRNPADVVPDADVVLITPPAFARGDILQSISPHLAAQTWVGAIPGNPGFNWQAQCLLSTHSRYFAVHRTPYICRTQNYGSEVAVFGVAPELFLAARPHPLAAEIADLLASAVHIPIVPVDSFLVPTLTPTNSIVHASRLFAMFRDWRAADEYNEIARFYADWDDAASAVLLECDDEIQRLCRTLPLDLRRVVPLRQHYSVANRTDLTSRIRALPALQGTRVPMTPGPHGYLPDLGHRFFLEDIPYGTVVVRAVAEVVGVATPMLDELIQWAQGLLSWDLLVNGTVRTAANRMLPIPQNFGIETIDTLVLADRRDN